MGFADTYEFFAGITIVAIALWATWVFWSSWKSVQLNRLEAGGMASIWFQVLVIVAVVALLVL